METDRAKSWLVKHGLGGCACGICIKMAVAKNTLKARVYNYFGVANGRLPQGQKEVKTLPVFDRGMHPSFDPETWHFKVYGEVQNPMTWNWDEFQKLPKREQTKDFHCVTSWSKLDVNWGGVPLRSIADIVQPTKRAHFVIAECAEGYRTSIPLEKSLDYFYNEVMPSIYGEENYIEKNRDKFKETHNTLTSDYFAINITYNGTDTTKPSVNYIFPENNTKIASNAINFTFNASDNSDISSCSLYIDNSLISTLSNIDDYFTLNFSRTFANSQNLLWSINCTDTSNNKGSPGRFNLTVDFKAPNVTIQSPAHRSEHDETSRPALNFVVRDDIQVDRCWYQLKECIGGSFGPEEALENCNNLSAVGNTSFSCNTLRVYVNDTTGNQNSSEANFTFFLSSARYQSLSGRSVGTVFSVAIGENISEDFVTVEDSFIVQEELGNNVVFAIIAKNSGTRFAESGDIWTIESKQSLQNNRFFIGFTKGGSDAVIGKIQDIDRFEMIPKSIGVLSALTSETIFLRLEYKDIDILDSLRIPSQRDIIVENKGRDGSLTKIGINRREG